MLRRQYQRNKSICLILYSYFKQYESFCFNLELCISFDDFDNNYNSPFVLLAFTVIREKE